MKVLLCLSVLLLGADARIKAPDSAPVGEYTLVDGTDAVGRVEWSVSDPEVRVYTSQDGKQIVLVAPSPRLVKVKQVTSDAAGKSADVVLIEFGGGKPAPGPAPLPMPDAKLPSGRFGIAQPAHDKAAEVRVATSDQRKSEALLLVAKLTHVRDRVQSGAIKADDPGAVMDAIRRANGELPRDVQSRWNVWGQWWGQSLFGQWKAGGLKAANDWTTILDETILGLKAVQ